MASSLFQNNQPTAPIPQGVTQIKNMMEAVKGAKSPQQLLQNMMMQNPQYQNLMNYANQFNGDYKSAFYQMANSRGIDPNEIINFMKSK